MKALMAHPTYKKMQPWIIWGLGAAFFFGEYVARVSTGEMVPQLMRDFHTNALQLGSLSAFFYYPYVLMQVPVGSMMDRFGPHRLLTLTSAICAFAGFLLSYTHIFWIAELARFLMGFGAAFAFVGALKLATLWFKPSRLGLLAGLTQGLGMLGAAIGAAPIAFMVASMGWRETMMTIGLILLVLSILICFFVRDSEVEGVNHHGQPMLATEAPIWEGFLTVVKNKQSWLNGFYIGLLYAPTVVFAELWGATYLKTTAHLAPEVAAAGISTVFVGWAIGSPLCGWVSDRMKRRKPVLVLSAASGLVILSVILFVPNLSLYTLYALLFLYGMTNTGVSVSYAVAGESNPRRIAGVSIAFTNMFSVIIGALFQPLIGELLDLNWHGVMQNGAPVYSEYAFHTALMTLPLCFALALVLAFFLRETHCRGLED